MEKTFRLSAALLLLLLALWTPRSGAIPIPRCPHDVRGCGQQCCFICFLTSIGIWADGSWECNYNECYTNCV